jgi:Sec-independent protein translocase protein TatA
MTWWAWVLIAIGVLLLLGVLLSLGDVRRYLRMRTM